jgi:hypothetical protein
MACGCESGCIRSITDPWRTLPSQRAKTASVRTRRITQAFSCVNAAALRAWAMRGARAPGLEQRARGARIGSPAAPVAYAAITLDLRAFNLPDRRHSLSLNRSDSRSHQLERAAMLRST